MEERFSARPSTTALMARLASIEQLPTVWTNVACGITLAGGDVNPAIVGLLLIAVSNTYVAGRLLGHAAIADGPAPSDSERPLSSATISTTTLRAAGSGLLATGFLLALGAAALSSTGGHIGAVSCVIALAAVTGAFAFVRVGARYAALLPGALRALLYAAAAYTTAPELGEVTALGMAAVFAYVSAISAAADGDDAAAQGSSRVLAVLAIPVAIALWLGRYEPAGLAFAVLFCGITLETVRPLLSGRGTVRDAVPQLIAGVSLLDAALIGGCGDTRLAVVAALGAVLSRFLRRYAAAG